MTDFGVIEIQATGQREKAGTNADPAIRAVDRLRRAAAERELVLLREPKRADKGHDTWDREQCAAGDKDHAAYSRLVKTVPTTAAGAREMIWAFLDHSLTADIIETYPQVRDVLENVSEYLRTLRPGRNAA